MHGTSRGFEGFGERPAGVGYCPDGVDARASMPGRARATPGAPRAGRRIRTAGDRAHAGTAGDRAHAGTAGDRAHAGPPPAPRNHTDLNALAERLRFPQGE